MPPNLIRQVIRFDRLHDAWAVVRDNAGAPGGDHVTLERFAAVVDEELLRLVEQVETRTYLPGPARRVHHRTGGKVRLLAIIPIRDRVLQRAVLDVLTPGAERAFLHCSYGYRPGRSVEHAIIRLLDLRAERGLEWVVDADIRDCFGRLDHGVLADSLHPFVPDPNLRELIALWYLPVPMALRPVRAPSRGINLGAPISPFLCNCYLHALDRALLNRRLQPVRYADDFVIACATREDAVRALQTVESVLATLKLAVNPAKTRIASFEQGFDFLGVHFQGDRLWVEHRGVKAMFDAADLHHIGELPGPYARWRD